MQIFLRVLLTLLLTLLEFLQVVVLLGGLWFCGNTGKWVISHWLDGTFSFWLTAGLWVAWFFGSLLVSFFCGRIIRRPFKEFASVGAWMWCGVFLAAAVYAWCLPPYSLGLIAARAVWSLLCIVFGLWSFLVVSFQAQEQ